MASEKFDAAYWESRYHSHAAHGERGPNAHLVAETDGLPTGRALDAGCGEGGNAVWLAERGWQVSAVDVSATALRRAREHGVQRGAGVAARIEWIQTDLTDWEPTPSRFDLVTALYVHPPASRRDLYHRLAAAVAPGGTLLIVDHAPADEHAHTTTTVDSIASCLNPRDWDVVTAETRTRRVAGPHGVPRVLRDVVVRADRRAAEPRDD